MCPLPDDATLKQRASHAWENCFYKLTCIYVAVIVTLTFLLELGARCA